jgi:threonine dehydratase
VVALDEQGNILLVRQFRHAVDRFLLEIPAGGIEPGAITFPLCRDLLDSIEVVPESLIARGLALVHQYHGRMVEGAGALPLAALLQAPAKWTGRTVVAVVSGGNISPERFRAVT